MMLVSDKPQTDEPLEIARWRMVIGYDLPGDYLMALDEALLEAVIKGGAPVVRFYTWQPATLSLGVNQHLGEVNPAECARRGFGLVRRLTGGRAVLHQHELTYSVIARENDPRVSGGVIESYRKISAALVEGLSSLGAQVALAEPKPSLHRAVPSSTRQTTVPAQEAVSEESTDIETGSGAVCFDTASAYELTANSKKLVGSAQARRGGVILQHGSVLLDIDWDAWVSVFSYATEAGKARAYTKLPTRMTSLRHELGRVVGPDEVQAALVRGFEQVLRIQLTPDAASLNENEHARKLVREKYNTDTWTLKI